jgi:Transposase.
MKKSRCTDSRILAILKQAENGVPVPELCREHGMNSASFYKWRAKFGGMDLSLMARMKELEKEKPIWRGCVPMCSSATTYCRKRLKKSGKVVSTR